MSLFSFHNLPKKTREGSLPTTVILPAPFSLNLPRSHSILPQLTTQKRASAFCSGNTLRARQKAEARFVRVVNPLYLSISLSTRISRAYPSSSFGVSR